MLQMGFHCRIFGNHYKISTSSLSLISFRYVIIGLCLCFRSESTVDTGQLLRLQNRNTRWNHMSSTSSAVVYGTDSFIVEMAVCDMPCAAFLLENSD
jgi:hypothetical protein